MLSSPPPTSLRSSATPTPSSSHNTASTTVAAAHNTTPILTSNDIEMFTLLRSFKDVKTRPVRMALGREYSIMDDDYPPSAGDKKQGDDTCKQKSTAATATAPSSSMSSGAVLKQPHEQQLEQQQQPEDSALTSCSVTKTTTREERMVRALCVACSQSQPVLEEVRLLIQSHPPVVRCWPLHQRKPWLGIHWLCNSGALSCSGTSSSSHVQPQALATLKLLVDAWPASIYEADEDGTTPLHLLARSGGASEACIRYLIQQQQQQQQASCMPHEESDDDNSSSKSLTDAANRLGILPLHYALRDASVSLNVVKLLYPTSTSTTSSTTTADGWSPLHIAARVGVHPKIIDYLVSRDQSSLMQRTNLQGALPLHLACLESPPSSSPVSSSTATTAPPTPTTTAPMNAERKRSIIQLLVQRCPQALQEPLQQGSSGKTTSPPPSVPSWQGNLPLHVLCGYDSTSSSSISASDGSSVASTDMATTHETWLIPAIQCVAQAWTPALTVTNAQGQTPLDRARHQLNKDDDGGGGVSSSNMWMEIVSYLQGLQGSLSSSSQLSSSARSPKRPPPTSSTPKQPPSSSSSIMSRLADETDKKLTLDPKQQKQQQHAEHSFATAVTMDLTAMDTYFTEATMDPLSSSATPTSMPSVQERLEQPHSKMETTAIAEETLPADPMRPAPVQSSLASSSATLAATVPPQRTGPQDHHHTQSMDDSALLQATTRRRQQLHARRIEDIQTHAQRLLNFCLQPLPSSSSSSSRLDITQDDLDISRKDQHVVSQWIEKVILDPEQADELKKLIALNDLVLQSIEKATARQRQVLEALEQRSQPPTPAPATAMRIEPLPCRSDAKQQEHVPILLLCRQKQLDVAQIRQALQGDTNGSLVKQLDDFDNCALHHVCGRGDRLDPQVLLECVTMLVNAWPDSVCIPNQDRMLPLHIAVREGAPFHVVEYLAAQWPDAIKSPNRGGSLPLHVACANGASLEIVQLLVQSWPVSTKIVNQYGWNALHSLCAHFAYRPKTVSGFQDNTSDVEENCINVVKYLVQQEPNAVQAATYHYQDLPLHMACERGAPLDVIRCLVEAHEWSVQTPNAPGQLALHKACGAMHLSLHTIQYLVQQSSQSVMTQDANGETPLDVLRRLKSQEIDEWLVRKNIKRPREQDRQPSDDDDNSVCEWWQALPPTDFTPVNLPSSTAAGPVAATTKKKLGTALKHDGRGVALVADNVMNATSVASKFACDWQESSPSTRFGLWLDASDEESLRQSYLSAIAKITKSGVSASRSTPDTISSSRSKRARLDLQSLADELVRVLWLLPRKLQWMVVFDNVQESTAMDGSINGDGQQLFFSNQSNWWNSRGRILVTTSRNCWERSSFTVTEGDEVVQGSRLLALSVDQ